MTGEVKGTPTFEAAPGSRISHADAQVVGEAVHRLMRASGECTPEALLREAKRAPKSRLYQLLLSESDEEAAHAHRLHLARKLIGAVVIRYTVPDQEPRVVRAFVSVKNEEAKQVYVGVARAARDPEFARQVVARAREDLLVFKRKYGEFRELTTLGPMLEAVEEALKT